MKLKIGLVILAVVFLIGIFYNLTGTAAVTKKLTLADKLDNLLLKQDEVLNRLDKVYDELIKIKMRLTRSLK